MVIRIITELRDIRYLLKDLEILDKIARLGLIHFVSLSNKNVSYSNKKKILCFIYEIKFITSSLF